MKKVKGKVVISKESSLVVDGDAYLENIYLDGSLLISGNGTFKDITINDSP
jgi:hypothetical protein